jgi:hypothetical protein
MVPFGRLTVRETTGAVCLKPHIRGNLFLPRANVPPSPN